MDKILFVIIKIEKLIVEILDFRLELLAILA